jgi:hypothetical protein
LGETKSGGGFIEVDCIIFSLLFSFVFSFPDPPRRVEKNSASKGGATKIQMKIGYTKCPDFGSRRGGLGQTKSGGGIIEVDCTIFLFFLLCFFLSPALKGGKKQCFEIELY